MIEVNLLPKDAALSSRGLIWFNRLILAAGTFLLLLLLDLAIFTGAKFFLQRRINNLSASKEKLSVSASGYEETAVNLRLVFEKLAGIEKVFGSRSDMEAVLAAVTKALGTGISSTNLSIDSTGTVSFAAKTSDPAILENFINKLTSDSHFSQVNMRGLRGGTGTDLSFQIDAKYQYEAK